MSVKAWVATAAKQTMVLQDLDLGPLGTEYVEVAVEHWGLPLRSFGVGQRLGHLALPGGPRPRGRRRVTPQIEHFPMSRINDALQGLQAGRARYRIVLDVDF